MKRCAHGAWSNGVTGIHHIDNEAIDINNKIIVKKTESTQPSKNAAAKASFSDAQKIVVLEEIQANKGVIVSRFRTKMEHHLYYNSP